MCIYSISINSVVSYKILFYINNAFFKLLVARWQCLFKFEKRNNNQSSLISKLNSKIAKNLRFIFHNLIQQIAIIIHSLEISISQQILLNVIRFINVEQMTWSTSRKWKIRKNRISVKSTIKQREIQVER